MSEVALDGLRVIELGQKASAPHCGKLFADYGADAIKVEPVNGDAVRHWGPFPDDRSHPEKSGLFFFLNTNKRGVTLDVGTPKGREIFLALLQHADVLIENNPPQLMRAWGLDYASLAQRFLDLVMLSIIPFGQTGPYAEWAGADLNAFHLSVTGNRYLGRPDAAPFEQATFSADFFGAYVAAAWGLAAAHGVDLVGVQDLGVSCAEVLAAMFPGAQNIGGYVQDGVFGMPLGAPCTILPCKDGYVWMMALEPGQRKGLLRAMGDPEWGELEMFQSTFTRGENAHANYPIVQQWTTERTKQEIMDICQANDCPTTAVYTVAELAEHPHIKERGHLVDVPHPVLGSVRSLGAPVRLPDSPGGPRTGAPLLGQHTDEVYGTFLGMSDAELAALRRKGIM
jgi:crotonobetainyl-CoA:carnitine CoA-transferase CaiB-like acyl-CoA transferase